MRTSCALGQHRRTLRFYCNDLDVGILGFQVSAHAGNRTASAYAGNENVYCTVCVVPDLHAGGLFMHVRICRIGELRRNEAVGDLRCQFLCLGDRTAHALGTLCQHQFCTVCFHQIATFNAHGFRHCNNQTIASGCRNGSQTNSGIAAGGFNDDTARLQQTLCLCIIDHALGDSVLNAASRIEIFQLAVDLCRQFVLCLQIRQFQQRCSADQICDLLINFHDMTPFPVTSILPICLI